MKKFLVLFALSLFVCQFAWAKPVGIKAKDAFRRIGDRTTVCGVVAKASYLKGSGREPTFLNLADTYPKHPFTVVIWGESRDQFDYAPETLKGKWGDCDIQGETSNSNRQPEKVMGGVITRGHHYDSHKMVRHVLFVFACSSNWGNGHRHQ